MRDDDGREARLGRRGGHDFQTESRRWGRAVRAIRDQRLERLAHDYLRPDLIRNITVTRRLISSAGFVSAIGAVAP